MNLSKNCSAFYLSTSTFNPPTSAALGRIMIMGAFGPMIDYLMGWGWSSLPLLLIWLSLVWSIPEAIHFTYKLHTWVIGVAIETHYCFHKSDFYKSDLSLRQFTSFMNCTLGFIIYLGPYAVITPRLSSHKSRFICYFRIVILLREIVL